MDPLTISAIVGGASAGIEGIKALAGGVQKRKYTKKFEKHLADRPMFEIPEEYKSILATYQKLSQGNMPGYDTRLAQIGQATGRATQAAERGAISSTAYQGATSNIYEKELAALQNLGVQSEEYQSRMQDKLTGAQEMMGGQKAEQWNINQYVPWQVKANLYGERAGAGQQSMWEGIGGMSSTLQNFAGTQAYLDAIKAMYPQGGTQTMGAGTSTFSSQSAQQSLIDTLIKNRGQIKR